MTKNILIGGTLIASLAVNFLLLGMLVGMHWSSPPRQQPPFPRNPLEILHLLPEARDRIQPIIRHHKEIRPKIHRLRQARLAVKEQIAASKLNSAGLEQAFAELRQAEMQMKTEIHKVFVAVLGVLTAEERQKLLSADMHRRPFPPPPHGQPPPPPHHGPPFLPPEDEDMMDE